jgi:chromosome partitioning protein
MTPLIISCLSQKGGVGKSTIARLIARTYAVSGWTVKICDFNTTQLTSVKWGRIRALDKDLPQILTEPYTQPSRLKREPADLVVADGRPDSDQSSLDIARVSDLVILPTGLSLDDLEPQLLFADELVSKGVPAGRVLFVLNKTNDSSTAVLEARDYLSKYAVAEQDLSARISYQRAQNFGKALSEVGQTVGTLEARADLLAAEIVTYVGKLSGAAA